MRLPLLLAALILAGCATTAPPTAPKPLKPPEQIVAEVDLRRCMFAIRDAATEREAARWKLDDWFDSQARWRTLADEHEALSAQGLTTNDDEQSITASGNVIVRLGEVRRKDDADAQAHLDATMKRCLP